MMYEHDWYKELWYAQGSDIIPAACEVRKEQQREKRAASSVRETAARRVRQARSDRRGKREDRDSHDEDERVEGRKSLVPEGRDGTEKGRPLRKKWRSAGRSEETETNKMKMRGREEGRMQRTRRREKREERKLQPAQGSLGSGPSRGQSFVR